MTEETGIRYVIVSSLINLVGDGGETVLLRLNIRVELEKKRKDERKDERKEPSVFMRD